jgi:diacylglycerol kinase family enzyme
LTDYVDLLSSLLRNRQEESESIIYFPAVKQIEVASDEPLPIHGDGEVLDIEMPFTATVVPNALTLIVPPQS